MDPLRIITTPKTAVEKRTIEFCREICEKGLDQIISRSDLREIIGKRYTTESTIDYEETVTDRLGMVEHPENPKLYTLEEDAEQQREANAEREAEEAMDALMNAEQAAD